jgi:signal transduction histidine kinase
LLEIATLLQSCKSEAALAAPLASSAIDAAQANSALMLELSAQLNDLYLQKIEGDEHHEVDLKQVLEESIALLTPLACQKDVSITATLAFSRAFGKRSQLSRLCNNLLANAVRFSPPGGEIAINLKNQNKDWLIFEIKDQGPGIDTADAADIFAPFVQAGAEKGRKSGFGLGLSICRRIVQSANGEIGYRPGDNGKNKPQTAGPGSIFWVKLPRYK